MIFNRHSELRDKHSFLSASKSSWSNDSEEKFEARYLNHLQLLKGVKLHALAAEMIRMRIRAEPTGQTFNTYVNDCIGWRMTPEQPLMYSWNAVGTADAIGYRDRILRVSDFKSGVSQTTVRQLEIYVAYFCLEYKIRPFEIEEIQMRIYQNDEVRPYDGDPDVIFHIMDRIVAFDARIEEIKGEVY